MQGEIVRWNDDRGFGFISSKDSKKDVFAHISQFEKGYRRPKVGDSVLFQVVMVKGKQSAKSISLIGVQPNPQDKQSFASILVSLLLLIGFASGVYAFVIKPKLYPAYEEMGFVCEGKTHCSSMVSCDEAKFYLANCLNVQIDGNNDGVPCERQLCNSSW
ncbi:cold shock domain-containing protein [Vibrio genomosp. F10]|uniref:cold shock domain-containing protein n=1 Tax=Vibrio genomosp. F10 TaxID=723171 RepID=UPI0002FF5936|nr:cold shock domain-containing protein [Vibrio genomosp. F10]OEF07614.1 cold-shock protein [Vibrio genomosp. F10 str. 9ZB36]